MTIGTHDALLLLALLAIAAALLAVAPLLRVPYCFAVIALTVIPVWASVRLTHTSGLSGRT
jgi:hypothetical protein